eukprot:SM000138S00063  [mRNA]  locus=s138:295357:295645:+ [translate_table: standard]
MPWRRSPSSCAMPTASLTPASITYSTRTRPPLQDKESSSRQHWHWPR